MHGLRRSAGGSQTSRRRLTNCTAPFAKASGTSKNNGKTETITIPIPTDYTCNYTSSAAAGTACNVGFGSRWRSHDVTTWDATVIGDPVRLIK